jgi:hypothetical protein
MVRYTRANGRPMIKVVRELCIMPMEINILAAGWMASGLDMGYMNMQMVIYMKVNGKMTKNID